MYTHSSVVESESKERQLKVEVLVNLRCGRVYIPLVVPKVLAPTLIVKPVHEVGPDLLKPLCCDDVRLSIVLVGGGWENATIDVTYKGFIHSNVNKLIL